jgi:hypothetical protein
MKFITMEHFPRSDFILLRQISSTLCSQKHSVYVPSSKWDQVSRPYSTAGKIIHLHSLIFRLFLWD